MAADLAGAEALLAGDVTPAAHEILPSGPLHGAATDIVVAGSDSYNFV